MREIFKLSNVVTSITKTNSLKKEWPTSRFYENEFYEVNLVRGRLWEPSNMNIPQEYVSNAEDIADQVIEINIRI